MRPVRSASFPGIGTGMKRPFLVVGIHGRDRAWSVRGAG